MKELKIQSGNLVARECEPSFEDGVLRCELAAFFMVFDPTWELL
jgi:hypothetical protein